ncbi:MAG: MogA/MoaB family molybdenum cofactor biosynthesis protein [Synergistaceae bacterium]|nr:MogA/MoaB family molybdenum cofactor biosynthesis protein [Synergistaceae bacterium]
MRILRLWAPSLAGDHTLCYLHTNSVGKSCVNDVETAVRYERAGERPDTARQAKALTIVLPPEAEISGGQFLAVGEKGGTLLNWQEKSGSFTVCQPGFIGVSEKAEIWNPIRGAVLTVSDKGSRGEREDTAGPELERLAAAQGCVVEERRIVPDDKEKVCAAVEEWSDKGINLILTTGGTGLSPRDNTPEALLSIAEKTVPGFGEMMRIETLKYTPRSFLTRSVAIIRKKTLVIAFPGSRRGAGQCFEAITGGLRHAVETLTGNASECGKHGK